MLLKDVWRLNFEKTSVFFMVDDSCRDFPFCHCCSLQTLYDDWMDEALICPENDAQLLQVVFYTQEEVDVQGVGNWTETIEYTKVQPIENIGSNVRVTFKQLMTEIESSFYFRGGIN